MTEDGVEKYKLIFLGDQGVGKSSILNRFLQDKFEDDYQATIGWDFHSKNTIINGANIRLFWYDTAGQEKFKSLIPMYIRDANIIWIVYDISIKSSFDNTILWVNETKDLKQEDAIYCWIGNKLDWESKRQVNTTEAETFAKERGFLFSEVSAKTGRNVQELFNIIIFPKMAEKYKICGENKEEEQQKDNNEEKVNSNIKWVGEEETKKKKKKRDVVVGRKSKWVNIVSM